MLVGGGFAKDWKECTEKRRGRDQVWGGGGMTNGWLIKGLKWLQRQRNLMCAPNEMEGGVGGGGGRGWRRDPAQVHVRSSSDCSVPKMLVGVANWVKQ